MRLCFPGFGKDPSWKQPIFTSHDRDLLSFAVTYNDIIVHVQITQGISDTKTVSFQPASLQTMTGNTHYAQCLFMYLYYLHPTEYHL